MITAVFNDKMDYTIAYGLWQWDYGQVLRIKGLDFDQISIEVHFSLSPDNTNSLVTIGVVKDIDYQSTIVSDGKEYEYTVNETATVLDVVIPKDMLWNNIKKNYTIYVFLLSTNEESGETLKRIIMPVKVKPKPLYSVTPEDEELFHRVVEEVNTFAETAKEHSNISKSYAVGDTGIRENENIDNAKYYAEQSALSAEASEQSASNALVSENHALDSENSALGAESRARTYATEAKDLKQEYDNTLALAKEYRDSAQASAISASANLRDTVTARNIATQASADANNFLNQTQAVYNLTVEVKQEVDETKADVDTTKAEVDAIKTNIDATKADITATGTEIATARTEVNTAKNEIIAIKSEVSDIKDATDEIKTDVINIANNINNSISEHNESTTAHPDIRSLISNLTNKLNTFLDTDDESLDQMSELITFIQNNKTLIEGITTSKVDKNQGIENAYKGLIVGEDGYVTLGNIGGGSASYYPIEITLVDSTYQTDHTCEEISNAFKNGLIPYAFIHGVEQSIYHLMTCSEYLISFVYLTEDNISIITISQNNTVTVNTNNPIIHVHQNISHKADKATTLIGYGITNAYTKDEVDNIINNLDTGVTSVNNKTGDVTITAQELGALTEHQDISGKADKSEIPTVPTNVSAFTNDSGYINDLSSYIYYSQDSNTVYINSATEITDADSVTTVEDEIGDLSQLTTTAKDNLVSAINEVSADAKAVGDALAEKADADDVTAIDDSIGDLSQLTTTAKTNLVSAINEAVADAEATGDAVTYIENAVNNRVSNDELYDGYQNKIPTYEHGFINGSGVYTSDTERYISGVYETTNNIKVVNNSEKAVYVVYLSQFTDFTSFTYGTYVTVNAGNELILAKQYKYFAVEGGSTTTNISEFRGVYIVGDSELEYLSNDSYVQLQNSLKDKLGKSELYRGVIYEAPTFEHGWINSSGVYNPSDTRFISQKFDTSEIDAVVNGSSKTIYVVYFSSFTDFSNFTYGTYVTVTSGDSLALAKQYPYFAIESTATVTTDLAGISVQKSSDVDYLAFDRIGLAGDEQLRNVEAARRTFTDTLTDNIASNPLPTFLHIADIHGDSVRFNNAVKIADAIGVDAIIDTGDDVFFNSTDSVAFIGDSLTGKNLVYLPTIGNHDSYTLTEQGMYEKYIDSHKTGLVLDSNVSYSTYYYKDFSDKKLRLISVNQFQYRGKSNNATERNYHQAQIDFLCGALLNTPDDYGVIVMIHTPEATPAKSAGYTKFYQDNVPYFNSGASIAPIYEIVDAFISGVALNKTFDNVSGNNPATFTVNVDFSGKNDSEFICFVSGHRHADGVYYLPNMTNKILMINSVCSNSWSHLNTGGSPGSNYPYFTELSDLPRVIGTGTENSINVFTVDRVRKSVRIVRIGSDMPYNFTERRDYMVIPYTD